MQMKTFQNRVRVEHKRNADHYLISETIFIKININEYVPIAHLTLFVNIFNEIQTEIRVPFFDCFSDFAEHNKIILNSLYQ